MKRHIKLCVLCCSTVVGLTQCRRSGEQSLYLIPNRFVGNVVIAFGQPQGAPAEYEGDQRVYRIPASGILRTQFPPNNGLRKMDMFFYSNATGALRRPLRYFNSTRSMVGQVAASDTICFRMTPVTDSHEPRGHYLVFLVSNEAQVDSLYERQYKEVQKVSDAK